MQEWGSSANSKSESVQRFETPRPRRCIFPVVTRLDAHGGAFVQTLGMQTWRRISREIVIAGMSLVFFSSEQQVSNPFVLGTPHIMIVMTAAIVCAATGLVLPMIIPAIFETSRAANSVQMVKQSSDLPRTHSRMH